MIVTMSHPTVIHERVEQCRQGTYPKLIARMKSGWAVLGDSQFLKGYCLLYPDPVVAHLNDFSGETRTQFLDDMAALGDAVLAVTGALRINYEMLGNVAPALHAHLFPRYEKEPDELGTKAPWLYPQSAWDETEFDEARDRPVMEAIKTKLIETGSVV
jgi:diadenosine tetraphosphate (Ap4A) HIT family hydrolase